VQLAAVDEIAAAPCGSAAAVSIPADASAGGFCIVKLIIIIKKNTPPSSHRWALVFAVRLGLADVHDVAAALLKPGLKPYRGYRVTAVDRVENGVCCWSSSFQLGPLGYILAMTLRY
jgi:hypothetical protein